MLTQIHEIVLAATIRAGTSGLDLDNVTVELSRKPNSGDIATNAAMVAAKQLSVTPIEFAEHLIPHLENSLGKDTCKIAGPGFINITLPAKSWYNHLFSIMFLGTSFGDGEVVDNRTPINIEYVSANPTGPLHIGHARGAIFGDVLAALFKKSGYEVVREYYVNDAGGQIDALIDSVFYRYDQLTAMPGCVEKPDNFYPGEYITDIAKAWIKDVGPNGPVILTDSVRVDLHNFVFEEIMSIIRDNLRALGITHDEFVYESDILAKGGAEKMLRELRRSNNTYKAALPPPKGKEAHVSDHKHLLFKSAQFGDDIDRPLKKTDGSWTYFATDIAYHMDKYKRGHTGSNSMINIWGADHAGYVARLKAALTALTDNSELLDVHLCQMVSLVDNGKTVKMSKRDNNFVLVEDVIDRVGLDALRFTMLTRKCDTQLTFDYQEVIKKSKENMVYYVQYAHARACSVIEKAEDRPEYEDVTKKCLERLTDPAEMALIKHMAIWPSTVNKATLTCEPHRIAYYLYDLASLFHSLWNKGNTDKSLRFIVEDEELTMARLILVQSMMYVLKSGLDIIGVSAPENM